MSPNRFNRFQKSVDSSFHHEYTSIATCTLTQARPPNRDNIFGTRAKRHEIFAAFLFRLPSVIGFIVFMAGSVLAALGISRLK